MTDLKDLRPAFLRLMPSFSEQVKAIPRQRAVVQKHVRAAVKKYVCLCAHTFVCICAWHSVSCPPTLHTHTH